MVDEEGVHDWVVLVMELNIVLLQLVYLWMLSVLFYLYIFYHLGLVVLVYVCLV